MTMNHPEHFSQADTCISVVRAEVDAAFVHLNRACSEDGRLSPKLLDQNQKLSYELAFCVAELEASKVMLAYAQANAAEDALCTPLALAFTAENLRLVWQRLLTHAMEAGLETSRLLDLMSANPLAAFLAEHGKVSGYEAIGAAMLERGNQRLPSGLEQEKDLVQASFARFAR